nr:RNA-directed DNA polymerase, eukaryota, reverse transcriptase zinc-binding domain protein [Tanacetum cinerariifolium]
MWSSIIKECNALKSQGLDLISHCKIEVGNGMSTSFWHDQWLGDSCLRLSYPRLFARENNKVCTVAAKMSAPFVSSPRRDVRGGEESAQLSRISDLLDTVVMLDDMLMPKSDVPSRWVKQIPIKVNVLAWKFSMNRLPTRVNLHRRGVQSKNLNAERKRREKLKNRMLELRSVVPKITNLNKETIIIDAIDYIQELKISVEDLTREIYAMEEEMANEQSFEIIQIRPEEKMKKWGIESEVAVTHIDENKLWGMNGRVLVATQVQGVIADIIKAI